jgi:hypothetical protein
MKKKVSPDASTGATSSRRMCVKRWRIAVISGPSPSGGDHGIQHQQTREVEA